MNPVKVFTKAVIVFASDLDESRGYVVTFVDGKVSAVYPHRPMAEVLVFAERLANNEADLELARIRSTAQANDCDHRGGAGVPTITRDTAPASGASLGSHVGGSMLTDDDKTEIDARITERISMFRETLIEQGQIQDVSLRGPSAIRPPSDCIQSARTHWGGQQEDPIPR